MDDISGVIHELFKKYAIADGGNRLTNPKYVKFCKSTPGLLNSKCTITDIDIIYKKIHSRKRSSHHGIDYHEFLDTLQEMAKISFPHDGPDESFVKLLTSSILKHPAIDGNTTPQTQQADNGNRRYRRPIRQPRKQQQQQNHQQISNQQHQQQQQNQYHQQSKQYPHSAQPVSRTARNPFVGTSQVSDVMRDPFASPVLRHYPSQNAPARTEHSFSALEPNEVTEHLNWMASQPQRVHNGHFNSPMSHQHQHQQHYQSNRQSQEPYSFRSPFSKSVVSGGDLMFKDPNASQYPQYSTSPQNPHHYQPLQQHHQQQQQYAVHQPSTVPFDDDASTIHLNDPQQQHQQYQYSTQLTSQNPTNPPSSPSIVPNENRPLVTTDLVVKDDVGADSGFENLEKFLEVHVSPDVLAHSKRIIEECKRKHLNIRSSQPQQQNPSPSRFNQVANEITSRLSPTPSPFPSTPATSANSNTLMNTPFIAQTAAMHMTPPSVMPLPPPITVQNVTTVTEPHDTTVATTPDEVLEMQKQLMNEAQQLLNKINTLTPLTARKAPPMMTKSSSTTKKPPVENDSLNETTAMLNTSAALKDLILDASVNGSNPNHNASFSSKALKSQSLPKTSSKSSMGISDKKKNDNDNEVVNDLNEITRPNLGKGGTRYFRF
eukprot:TRINITY_DN1625_c0_g1_i1.p1 TRINITY_DN1625_c0_g1~~TRINITY_DN1625_c0_g1_i1.p1  ORF type:complete len:658 (-),score=223.31 TRINITY_DN1625_c0_g1_i1:234-2207(-)